MKNDCNPELVHFLCGLDIVVGHVPCVSIGLKLNFPRILHTVDIWYTRILVHSGFLLRFWWPPVDFFTLIVLK